MDLKFPSPDREDSHAHTHATSTFNEDLTTQINDQHEIKNPTMRPHNENKNENPSSIISTDETPRPGKRSLWSKIHLVLSIALLFLNYFTSQYDKFILSYFQDSFSAALGLSATEYGVLSGYATGIVYAILALPLAFIADYFPSARVWTLSVAAVWWSLCVVFQSLCHSFWQVLLARIGMGIGQSCVEAVSISLLSDLVRWRNVFLGSSCFYVGVYVGEAVSGQIAVAFPDSDDGWRIALRAIGITGIVLAILVRLVIRDPTRQRSIIGAAMRFEPVGGAPAQMSRKVKAARDELRNTLSYILRMRSFWILVLSAGIRQLAGNVFGYYMPSYLANTYPDKPELLSRYGIIVGVVGTFAVLAGGVLTSILWPKTKLTPLYITGIGGMISSLFVLLMIFSRDVAHGNQDRGVAILYATMSLAYVTAELWLGSLFGFVALILPPKYKTYGLAIWSTVQVLIYSAGPQIIGLALRNTDIGSEAYTRGTQIILAVMIPVCYWMAGIGFLFAISPLKCDLEDDLRPDKLPGKFKGGAWAVFGFLVALVVALFVTSIVYAGA